MEPSSTTANPLVLLNPAANRGRMRRYRELVRARAVLEAAEYRETCASGEAEACARQAADAGRAVIIVGGDGSVHEVVNGVLASGQRVPLGIVAAGSGNDYAWNTLNLPHDPVQALDRAFRGRLLDVDAGRVNGRYFANAFSLGLDADIAAAAHRLKRWPFMSGSRLYYSATLKQLLFGYRSCPWISFTFDGELAVNMRRYVLLAVNNGPTYGAGFRINPTADPTDGYFTVCCITYMPLLRALKLLPLAKKGKHAGIPEVHFFQARTLCIESRSKINRQVDGETSCAQSYRAEILPGALLVRV